MDAECRLYLLQRIVETLETHGAFVLITFNAEDKPIILASSDQTLVNALGSESTLQIYEAAQSALEKDAGLESANGPH